jgi:hypothetical protein
MLTAPPAGSDFLVNTTTANDQFEPSITGLPDGRFVVMWWSFEGNTNSHDIRGRVFNADGTADPEFVVNTNTPNAQRSPSITSLADGRFVVTWYASEGDTNSYDIRGRVYARDGTPAGSDFIVNTTTTSEQFEPTITGLADGRFVVTWWSFESGSNSYEHPRPGIQRRRHVCGQRLHRQHRHGERSVRAHHHRAGRRPLCGDMVFVSKVAPAATTFVGGCSTSTAPRPATTSSSIPPRRAINCDRRSRAWRTADSW